MASSPTTPTKEEIAKLPRWARVAFAARCARRVFPLVENFTGLSSKQKEMVRFTIEHAEFFAMDGQAEPGSGAAAAESATEADAVAGAAAEAERKAINEAVQRGVETEGLSAANAAHAAANAADAAANAARAAANAADAATEVIDAGAGAAANGAWAAYAAAAVTNDAHNVNSQIGSDFESILRRAMEQKWTDQTTVSPDDFGLMWPNGAPEWATTERGETAKHSDLKDPTPDEILKLPKWAVVAFAARCARRVLPLAHRCSVLSPEDKAAIVKAVWTAEQSSSSATSLIDPELAFHANVIARRVGIEAAVQARFAEGSCEDTERAASASRSAASAAKAAEVSFDSKASSQAAADAAAYAVEMPGGGIDLGVRAAIRGDLYALLQHVRKEKWTDETPVPANVFGPLWPNGAPDWATEELGATVEPLESHGKFELEDPTFDVWIDPGAASVGDIEKLFAALSDLNRAHGGSGLRFDQGKGKVLVLQED